MAEAPSPLPTSAGGCKIIIKSPTAHDVLFGRGGSHRHEGNVRFHELVDERKNKYTQEYATRKEKAKLAREVYTEIHEKGGRFLDQAVLQVKDLTRENIEEHISGGGWIEVEKKIALEKCKQALRQNRGKRKNFRLQGSQWHLMGDHDLQNPGREPEMSSACGSTVNSNKMDYRVGMVSSSRLFQDNSFWTVQQQRFLGQFLWPGLLPTQPNMIHQGAFTSSVVAPRVDLVSRKPTEAHQQTTGQNSANGTGEEPFVTDTRGSLSDADASDFLFRYLLGHLLNVPRFTEEQAQIEQANLTRDERDAALHAMFGRMCTIHQRKRTKRDDMQEQQRTRELVEAMKLEINLIPSERKLALVEAELKCSVEEFSDSRLARFLRCEEMSPKLGAERFVRYWECRRKLFGDEKYVKRMTLSEALKDDLVALEVVGYCYILPRLDASGRQLIFRDTSLLSRGGCSPESLLRASWYVMEVCTRENNDAASGTVFLGWAKDTTVWDYDRRIFDPLYEYFKKCWPLQIHCWHICCPSSSFLVRMLRPFVYALMDKEERARTLTHDVPESMIAAALEDYGIQRHMLPRFMGGTLDFGNSDWIASRRAAEMEEL